MQPKAAAEFLLKAEVVATAWCVGCTHQTYGFESAKAEAGCREISKPCQELSSVAYCCHAFGSAQVSSDHQNEDGMELPTRAWDSLELFSAFC